MSKNQFWSPESSTTDFDLKLNVDVLVIGGGPSGTWAAWTASQGASVVLVDKGYCGTTGCAAASGNGVWYVPPALDLREAAMASREANGGFLSSRRWMTRVLDQTYANVNLLAEWGYPAFSSVTKTLFYNWATFTYEDGSVISGANSQRGRSVIAKTLLTQPVYAILDKATEEMQTYMRSSQPNFFLPLQQCA